MQTKHKLLLTGWLICHLLTFVGWRIEMMTYEWCMRHNHATPGQVNSCAAEYYSTWYHTGRVLQYNPASELFYFAASIIDGE